ncbi:MAG: VWA domain-containing protein [Methylophilaceae bacterium]|jgi:mxaL protein|nr:MAG: VWA domain-containing protein [Methylophilaceae bacterium]
MQNWIHYLKKNKDAALLSSALVLLIVAMFRPTLPVKHNIYTYLLVADISQSMNTADIKKLNGKTITRMEHMQTLMHEVVSSLPCGTKVGISLFAGVSTAALYHPIEVCENFHAIQDTIDHLDWRTAWSGNSRIRENLYSISRTLRSFPKELVAQVVLFTDGEEAPKLHVFNTKDLKGLQDAKDWLIVGIGSAEGAAIPKLSQDNQVIGYWSNESFALQPGIAQISESNIGTRNDSVASGEFDRYISKLDEAYLKEISQEIDALYVRGDSIRNVLNAMSKQKPARRDIAPFDISWFLAGLAGLLLLGAYYSKHPLKRMAETIGLYKRSLKKRSEKEAEIAHDNYIN